MYFHLDLSISEEETVVHGSIFTSVDICNVFIKEEDIEELKGESECEGVKDELDSSVIYVVKKEVALQESEMCAIVIKEEFIAEESQCEKTEDKLHLSITEEETIVHKSVSTPIDICSGFVKEECIEELKQESEFEDVKDEFDSSVTSYTSVIKKETALDESEMCGVLIKEEFIVEESQCEKTEDKPYSTLEEGNSRTVNYETITVNVNHFGSGQNETDSSPLPVLLEQCRPVEPKKKYQCHICNKSFTQSGSLSQHKLIHAGIKKHKCDICNKIFTQSSHLSLHKLIHLGIKKFQCDVCYKNFTQSSTLLQHKLIHAGIKKYQCAVCNKSFTQSGQLSQHKSIHTGIKKHRCDICSKLYSQAQSLAKHKLIHDDNTKHPCNYCSKIFTQPALLLKHKIIHIDIEKY